MTDEQPVPVVDTLEDEADQVEAEKHNCEHCLITKVSQAFNHGQRVLLRKQQWKYLILFQLRYVAVQSNAEQDTVFCKVCITIRSDW